MWLPAGRTAGSPPSGPAVRPAAPPRPPSGPRRRPAAPPSGPRRPALPAAPPFPPRRRPAGPSGLTVNGTFHTIAARAESGFGR